MELMSKSAIAAVVLTIASVGAIAAPGTAATDEGSKP
jgi:hypothetical protein